MPHPSQHPKRGEQALCENVFMILVSVLNSIPIFIIG
jgi:hypothetical protein